MTLSAFKLCRLMYFQERHVSELDQDKKLTYGKVALNQQNIYFRQISKEISLLLTIDSFPNVQENLMKSQSFPKFISLFKRGLAWRKYVNQSEGLELAKLPIQLRRNKDGYQKLLQHMRVTKQLSSSELNKVKEDPFDETKLKESILNAHWNFSKQLSYNQISQKICSLFNQIGTNKQIFIGVDPQSKTIIGLDLTISQINNILSQINDARQNYIFPTPSEEEIQVSFIRLDLHHLHYGSGGSSLAQHKKYVIKISVQPSMERSYFIKSKLFIDNTNSKAVYKMWADNNSQIEGLKIYEEMHRVFYQKKRLPKMKIKSDNINQVQEENIGALSILKNAQLSKAGLSLYGQVPENDLEYHSILILSKTEKAKKLFESLRSWVLKRGNLIVKEIYEKIPRTNRRNVFYLSHSIPTSQLLAKVVEIDNTRKIILLMKIKTQLGLLRTDFFSKAYSILKQRFENYFNQQLRVVYKYNSQNKLEYYFLFESQVEAIFSFIVLQYSDIRTNFIGEQKVKNGWIL